MYEKPVLMEAGKITETVLGIFGLGDDMDGSLVPFGMEFECDAPDAGRKQ